jgi:hypothetical protein
MNNQEIIDGLTFLNFTNGYVVGGEPAEIILWEHDVKKPSYADIKKASVQGASIRERKNVENKRLLEYQTQSDPLFFGWQRGDNTEQEWLDAIQAVKDANPYPVKEGK